MDKKTRRKSSQLRRGFPKIYGVRITLPLTNEMLVAIDAAREEGETRLDVIRAAIERELKRRV